MKDVPADIAFALPEPPGSMAVLAGAEAWREPLRVAGLVEEPLPALVIAPARRAAQALLTGAPMAILLGRPPRQFGRAGFHLRVLLPMPGLFLPLDCPNVARYALRRLLLPTDGRTALRNRVAELGLRSGALRLLPQVVTVAAKGDVRPFAVRAASVAGVPPDADWLLRPGVGDPALKRNVFYLFEHGADHPCWVLKVARRRHFAEPFDREERGLALATAAGPVVASRAPRLRARWDMDGLHASVETAAPGIPLLDRLRARMPLADRLHALELVAEWLLDVARATAQPPDSLDRRRRRLADFVVAPWVRFGATADLVDGLEPISGVFQHNDLWPGNVLVAGDRITVIDWESAVATGLPLWDLLILLADALAVVDGADSDAARLEHFTRLFRGELENSAFLFACVRRAADEAGVPAGAVGRLASLCWLDRGLREWAGPHDGPAELRPLKSRLAHAWLDDPALGATWSRWL